MAKVKESAIQEYRSMEAQALADKIAEEEVRLTKMKFGHAVNPIENPLSIRQLRRDIARMKMVHHQKTLEA